MSGVLTIAGPWGVVATLVTLIVTGFVRRWIVPWGTVEMMRTQQQQITDLHKEAAALERARADLAAAALAKLTAELPEALRQIRTGAA